jgi:phenylpyruvate tautomerase PptA (4-oxalocrotonate tautomerase family)
LPLIDVTYPAGAIDDATREQLIENLMGDLLAAERAPDTQFFRDVTWIFVHELPADHVFTAGKPVDKPIFKVEATTPEGALSDRRRAEFVESATAHVRDAADIPDEEALRVFVIHREVAEGSWGAAGQVVMFSALREAAKAEREKAGSAEPVPS